MKRLLVLLATLAAMIVPATAGAQVPALPPLAPELQAILDCEDPAFPPQSPSGQCATYIPRATDGQGNASRWNCTQPLVNYGVLPIIVNHIQPTSGNNGAGAIALGNTGTATPARPPDQQYPMTGCHGPGAVANAGGFPGCNFDGKADLFLQINGNRTTLGSNNDLVKTFGAHCIEIGDATHSGGKWTGGAVTDGAHQDGHNCNYCRNLHYFGIEIGDWEKLGTAQDSEASGAHGAGGLWYMDWLNGGGGAAGDQSYNHFNIVCDGCIMVGSEHPGGGSVGTALSFYESDSSGAINSCFAANHPLTIDLTQFNHNRINSGNTFYDRDAGGAVPDCPLLDDDPPPPPVDTDGDGVPDAEDNCPTEPGPPSNGGCPIPPPPVDTDGDGVPDTEDQCPTEPGPPSNGGCPIPPPPVDTDGDGVPDTEDNCPNEPGPVENDGCPLPPPPTDNDGDGVPNDTDNCVEVANPGQEDSDGDGAGNACDTPTWAQYDALAALLATAEDERDTALAERDAALLARDEAVTAKNQALAERDAALAQVAGLQAQITDLQAQLTAANALSATRLAQLNACRSKLTYINGQYHTSGVSAATFRTRTHTRIHLATGTNANCVGFTP